MAETSIVFKANDQVSGAMRSMSENSQTLSKQYEVLERRVSQLSQKNDQLNKSWASAMTQLAEAKQTLKEAETAFKKTGDEESRLSLQNAVKQFKDLTDAANAYKNASQSTQKAIRETHEEIRKLGNGSSGENLLSKLAGSGLLKMAGDSLSGFMSLSMESGLGQPTATFTKQMISGAASGAAAGALLGPAGVLGGAAMGAIFGGINGYTQITQQKDEAFKSYYKGLYDTAAEETDASVTSGRSLAAGRETDEIAFSRLLGGADVSRTYLADVRDMANRTPFLYSDLTSMSKSLAPAFGGDPERMLELMQAIGDAGASVGLDTSGMQMVGTAISRMESTGKTTLEYLNILQERGIDAYGFLAGGLSKSKEEMLEMVSRGLIPGAEAAQLIQQGMEGAYHGAMELQSHTASGLESTLEGLQENVDAAGGASYNAVRSRGLEADIAAYDGPLGRALEKASEISGANRAYLDNLQAQYQREALSSVLLGPVRYGEQDGTGDVYVMLTVRRYRKLTAQITQNDATGNRGRSAQRAQQDERTHRVVRGDTLWGIARKMYGDGALCWRLASYNGIKNANLIYPGQTVRCPDESRL